MKPATSGSSTVPRLSGFPTVLALLVALHGCGSESNDNAPRDTPDSVPERPSERSQQPRVRGDTIEVWTFDEEFELATLTPPAGTVVFEVLNLGIEYHYLEIYRSGSLVGRLDREVGPGETRFLEVTLEPGRYIAIYAVAGSDKKGMQATLSVEGGNGGP